MGNLLISGRHSVGKRKRQVAPHRIDALVDNVSTFGLHDDGGVTSRHRRNRLFTPILENFPFWKTRSWEIRIGRQANYGVVREPGAFRLAKSDNTAVSPAIGTVKIKATPNARKSLKIQPADRSNCCLVLRRNKPNSSREVRVHSIFRCEKFDRDIAKTNGSGATPSLPP